jgi:hypothetical protein
MLLPHGGLADGVAGWLRDLLDIEPPHLGR